MMNVITSASAGIFFLQIIEESYEYGTHYVLYVDGEPGFHSYDYDRVKKYMDKIVNMSMRQR